MVLRGPDQAAHRLGVRRADVDHIAGRLGWLSPVGSVEIDYKRQSGVTRSGCTQGDHGSRR
ncbi:hypothetical protein [Streptomyces toxytricini]|uniref:hypothetical protein n=1 Tax=Streptomyces toxytricini TaxID=67369 RepID=UPI00342019A1